MRLLNQAFDFALFTVAEYARSGRILLELGLTLACLMIFFRSESTPSADYFFSIASTFSLLLCAYSASTILAMGDRPQGYVLLAHGLSRKAYLLGLFLASVLVVLAAYGILSAGVALLNPIEGLDMREWLAGSLPLGLNVLLVAALLTLLAPFVLRVAWRLLMLAFVAIAFSGALLSGPTLAALPSPLASILDVLRTIFSTPLLPAFTGFALSVSRDYSGLSMIVPLSQLLLVLGILGIALWQFSRRELVLGH